MGYRRFTRGHGLFGRVRATKAYIGAVEITPTTITAVPVTEEVRTVSVSFATAGLGTIKLYWPYRVTINKLRAVVTSTIGITADATITCGSDHGASTTGVLTIPGGSVVGTEVTATPTTNLDVTATTGYYYLTMAKGATVGGTAQVTIECTKTA